MPNRDAVVALAKNLVLARTARGITQDQLAERANVSRATIAQIESGESDPRLSTMADLSAALGTTPLLLLLGQREISAIAELVHNQNHVTRISADLSDAEVQEMRRLIEEGLPKGQKRAVELGVSAAAAAGAAAAGGAVGAAIGTLLLPGIGTAIGAALGTLLQGRITNPKKR